MAMGMVWDWLLHLLVEAGLLFGNWAKSNCQQLRAICAALLDPGADTVCGELNVFLGAIYAWIRR